MHQIQSRPGTYVLVRRSLREHPPFPIGKSGCMGTMPLWVGYYLYIGSAHGGGGFRGRLKHHLDDDAPLKWNIDYLKTRTCLERVFVTYDDIKRECAWARVVMALPGAEKPLKRFGANDCKTCEAHLLYFAESPTFSSFVKRVHAAIPGHAPIHEVDNEALMKMRAVFQR